MDVWCCCSREWSYSNICRICPPLCFSDLLQHRLAWRQWLCSLPTRAAAGSCPENNKHSRRAPVERQAFREGKRGHPSMQEMPGPALLDMKWFGLYAQSASARRNYNKRHGEAFARKYSPGPEWSGLQKQDSKSTQPQVLAPPWPCHVARDGGRVDFVARPWS